MAKRGTLHGLNASYRTETTERPDNYKDNQAFISYPIRNQQRNLFCMYTLWCNDSLGSISCLNKDKMRNFGEYGIIITNPHKFINLVATASEKNSSITQVHCGFVNYIPKSQMKNVMEMNPFRKPEEDFSYQNEFRICADTDILIFLNYHLGENYETYRFPYVLRILQILFIIKIANYFSKPKSVFISCNYKSHRFPSKTVAFLTFMQKSLNKNSISKHLVQLRALF